MLPWGASIFKGVTIKEKNMLPWEAYCWEHILRGDYLRKEYAPLGTIFYGATIKGKNMLPGKHT